MPNAPGSQAVIDALGWALVHFLWQGFAFALLFAVLTTPRLVARASTRHALGVAVLFAAAVAPLATFWFRLADAPATGGAPALFGATPGAGFWLGAGVDVVLPWVVGLWALGVALLTARLVLGWFGCRRLAGRLTRPVDARLDAVVASLVERLRLTRPVRVLASARVSVPTVIGWLRPVVLLPVGAVTRMGVEQLAMVLAHEFAHVRRCDWLVNLAQRVIETLLFYHPAIRWMSRRIREERELACDDIAVELTGRPVAYARALAELESLREAKLSLALAATGGDLRHRVERIVGQDTQRADGAFVHFTVLATLTAALTFGAADMVPRGEGLRETAQACPASRARERAIGARAHAALDASEAPRGAEQSAASEAPRLAWSASPSEGEAANSERPPGGPLERASEAPVGQGTRTRLEALAVAAPTPRRVAPEPVLLPVRDVVTFEAPPVPDADALLATLAPPPAPLRAEPSTDATSPYALLTAGRDADAEELTIVPRYMVAPEYPFRARLRGDQGFVKLAFSVDPDGRVSNIEVLDAIPRHVFDRVAKDALREWRFDVDERLTENLRMVQTFDFVLEEEQHMSLVERRRCRGSVARTVCDSRSRMSGVAYVSPPRRVPPQGTVVRRQN